MNFEQILGLRASKAQLNDLLNAQPTPAPARQPKTPARPARAPLLAFGRARTA